MFFKLEVKKSVGNSTVVQEIYFYHHSPLIKFSTRVDWDECQKILRVAFPVSINSLTATYDVAFGNIERPNHLSSSFDQAKFEVCAHKWADLSEMNYGVALLNESKYGYSIQNSDIQLSLLRSANYPSDSCDKGQHAFSYWLYPHQGALVQAQVAQQGYEVNESLMVFEGKISGTSESFITTDSQDMIIDTVKRSEDGRDIIIRVFETYNSTESEAMTFSVPVVKCEECDLMERKISEIQVNNKSSIKFGLKPFEIKSFRICLE